MTAEEAGREAAEIRAMAISHDDGRVFPAVDPAVVQAARQRMPGLREERRQAAA